MGFFQRLAERTLGASPSLVQPLVPSIFANGGSIEPAVTDPADPLTQDADREAGVSPEPRRAALEVQSLLPSRESQPLAGERKREISEADKSPEAAPKRRVLSPGPVSLRTLVPTPTEASAARTEAVATQPQTWLDTRQREFPNEANPGVSIRTPPVIRVTIGRVEVRAELPPVKPARAAQPASSPALSLSEYQRQRDGGLR